MNSNLILYHHSNGKIFLPKLSELIDSRELIEHQTAWVPIKQLKFYNPVGDDEMYFRMIGKKYNDKWQGQVIMHISDIDHKVMVDCKIEYNQGVKHGLVIFKYSNNMQVACRYYNDRLINYHPLDPTDLIWCDDHRRYDGKTITSNMADLEMVDDGDVITVSRNDNIIWKLIK